MERRRQSCLDLRNQIYCMDCMELMAHIPDGFVSLILTDPPYGIAYQNHFARQPHEHIGWGLTGLIMNALRGKVTAFCGTIPTLIFLPGLTAILFITTVCEKQDLR